MKRFASALFAAAVFAAAAVPVAAQYPFGKNKVVYTNQKWKVLKTGNVDIYYYPDEESLVRFAAPMVEQTFREYAELFELDFDRPLPLVLYSSHYDFQQTNIIPSLISDYTAGFTDLAKGRIAIPFSGSLWEFRHVVRHEMAHAFMLEKLKVVLSSKGKFATVYPPLWFVEGLAEYIANPRGDTRSHMFMRDGLLNDYLPDLQNIWRIEGSFLMYKEGEAVVRYIAENFGDEALVKIVANWWRSDDFSLVLKNTIGLDLIELNDAFFRAMKRRYYPSVMYAAFTSDVADQVTEPGSFHSRPIAVSTGQGRIAVYALGAQDGVISLIRIARDDYGRPDRKVVIEGSRSVDYESIPAFRSKLEARGDTLMFVSKRHNKDAVYLWSMSGNRKLRRLTWEHLSVISSPTFSPDGSRIAFTAIDRAGQPDLFMYDMDEDVLARLTDDVFSEQDPDFHPTRNTIIFSSDRCHPGSLERYGIYSLDVDTGGVTALTCGAGSDSYPEWAPDGRSFLFSSDREGVYDIYSFDMETRRITRQTRVLGGVTMPAYLADQSGFVASVFQEGEYHIFEFPLKDGVGLQEYVAGLTDTSQAPSWKRDPEEFSYKTEDYKQKLSVDFAGAGVAIDPNYGSIGNGGQIVLTDILGNHQYYFFFGNSSQGADDFFRRLNLGVEYVNLSHRLHFSLGAFHLNSYTADSQLGFRYEKRVGVSSGLSYPLSRFARVDGSIVGRFIEREAAYAGLGLERSFVGSLFLSHVVDKTLWTIGGPLKGWRYYLTGGHTFDFRNRGFDNSTLHFDLRKYFKITDRVIFAQRFQTRHIWGSDSEILYLGGPWDLRGFDFREFFGKSTFLLNNELRFPLVDRFAVGFPFGTLETPRMRGSLFFDLGRAYRFADFDTDWLGAFGLGAELNLGYAPVIRVNFTRVTDFRTISSDTGFELFIGYNY